jgi:hypothetical protein
MNTYHGLGLGKEALAVKHNADYEITGFEEPESQSMGMILLEVV